jgi:hypothetical protein
MNASKTRAKRMRHDYEKYTYLLVKVLKMRRIIYELSLVIDCTQIDA